MDMATTIRKLRKKLGITQLEFSRIVGVAPSTANAWELGNATPEYKRLPAIAAALRTTVAKLVA